MTLALASCGGDGAPPRATATASSEPAAASDAERSWARRADAACRRHRPRLVPIGRALEQAVAEAPPGSQEPTKPMVRALSRLDRALSAVFEDLRAIPRPPDAKRLARFVALYGETVFEFHSGVTALRPPNLEVADRYFGTAEQRSAQAHDVAQQIGVTQCTPALADRGSG